MYARQALERALKSADPIVITGAYQNLSFAQIEVGQYHQAHQNIHSMLETVRVSGSHHYQTPRLLNLMGYLRPRTGRPKGSTHLGPKSS